MNKDQKCDAMTQLIFKIMSKKSEKAEAMKDYNEEIKDLEEQLLIVARKRTDQTELNFPQEKESEDAE
jgi:hypothetical protein